MLDEVDTLSLMAQAKLLRFLQDGEYRPVGSARSSKANVRVIAATNTDLITRVEARQFREDLYYRLNALSLTIPSLRERIDDVAPLASHFLDRFGKNMAAPLRQGQPKMIILLAGDDVSESDIICLTFSVRRTPATTSICPPALTAKRRRRARCAKRSTKRSRTSSVIISPLCSPNTKATSAEPPKQPARNGVLFNDCCASIGWIARLSLPSNRLRLE